MLIDAPPTLLNAIIHKKHLSHFMANSMNELAHKSPLIKYFRLNFVSYYDVMKCTTQSIIKTRLSLHFFAILNKIMISATYTTYPLLLNTDISVL